MTRLELRPLEDRRLPAGYFVAVTGDDAHAGTLESPFRTVQHALDTATSPGDTVTVRAGKYREQVRFPASGAAGNPITLQAFDGERPILTGKGLRGEDMVLIENRNFVRIVGFEIKNNRGVTDGSGVRILGAGQGIEIRDNVIHDLRGKNAMGITVYGTSETDAVFDLVIDGNEIYDCMPAPSEALTLNGNVRDFAVTNNRVHHVNNIGIDLIGGETDINPTQVVRDGVVSGNVVHHARASYGGGFGAGIYVDGAKDVVIENNVSYRNDLGLEVGAENPGTVTSGVVVRNNLLYRNAQAGLVFGGYAEERGRVVDSTFVNNTLWKNDTRRTGFGELWIQYARDNVVANNIFWAGMGRVLLSSDAGSENNDLDHNLWFADAGAEKVRFTLNGERHLGFAAYRTGTGQDAESIFGDARFVDAVRGDFHLLAGSPAIDAGGGTAFAATDLDGDTRPQGAGIDIGADELTAG